MMCDEDAVSAAIASCREAAAVYRTDMRRITGDPCDELSDAEILADACEHYRRELARLRAENGRLREANVRLERLVHIMGDKMGWMVSVVSGEGKRWEEDGNKAVALSFALVTETIVKGHGYEPDGECMAEFDELIAALGITLDAAEGGENGSA